MWASMWPSLLMALFQRFWRWLTVISRAWLLMVDEPSSLGEAVMLGAGSIEHRELIHYTVSKSTTFEPPHPGLDHVRRATAAHRDSRGKLKSTHGNPNQSNRMCKSTHGNRIECAMSTRTPRSSVLARSRRTSLTRTLYHESRDIATGHTTRPPARKKAQLLQRQLSSFKSIFALV